MSRTFLTTFFVLTIAIKSMAQPLLVPKHQHVQQMSIEERRAFYRDLNASSANDLLELLAHGLGDADAGVRRNAAGKAAFLIARLNQFAASGRPAALDSPKLQQLTEALSKGLNDTDREVRGFTVSALTYSDAPSAKIEGGLLGRFAAEADEEIRSEILRTMALAGYSSPAFSGALINALSDASPKVRERAAGAVAVAKPDGALPKLAALLSDQQMVRDSVVQAIAAYGADARPYLGALKKLLSEPVGAPSPERVRAAIESIKTLEPLPLPDPPVKAVRLTAANQDPPQTSSAASSAAALLASTPEAAAALATSPAPTTPASQARSIAAERKAQLWQWLVGTLTLMAIVAFALKRRA